MRWGTDAYSGPGNARLWWDRCEHCHGTGHCPIPFCIRCEAAAEHLSPGDCLACCGEGFGPEPTTASRPNRPTED